MYDLAQAGFSSDEVKNILTSNRTISYGFELLDKNDNTIGSVHASDCRISNNADAKIQRVASMTIIETKDIDFIYDRIRPYMQVEAQGKKLIYPLGIFLLSSPSRKAQGGSIARTIDCYDKTQILSDDKFDTRYTVNAGTAYTGAVANIISSAGITKMDFEQSALETAVSIEFPIGTSKLDACNSLLDAINYVPLYADSYGYIRTAPYVLPEARSIDAYYITDKESITCPGAEEELDIFNAPNKIVRYLENAERGVLISSATNDDPNSKLSTVSRGRTIVDIEAVDDVPDQTTLDAMVQRIMAERKIYQRVIIETLNMPNHEYNDCIYINNSEIDVNGKYIETAWDIDLSTGGKMRHILKKAVSL